MNWRQTLIDYANTLGRQTHVSDLGIGIEFADGCAAFWVLPGEVMSTVDLPSDATVDVKRLIEQYEKLDARRGRVLGAMVHLIVERGAHVLPCRAGAWTIALEWGESVVPWTGNALSIELMRRADDVAVLEQLLPHCFIPGERPTHRDLKAIMEVAAPFAMSAIAGAKPLPQRDDDTRLGDTVRLWDMFGTVERSMKYLGIGVSPEEAVERVRNKPGLRSELRCMFERLAAQLPTASASWELTTNALSIEFDDQLDELTVNPRKRRLLRSLRKDGAVATADRLVNDYRKRNDARGRVLTAVSRAAVKRGWGHQMFNPSLCGPESTCYLGSSRREVGFDPGARLTMRVRKHSEVDVIRRLFADHADFAQACLAELDTVKPGDSFELPPAIVLPPDATTDQPSLAIITSQSVAEMDCFAAGIKRQILSKAETLWNYGKPEFFTGPQDTWSSMDDWLLLTEKCRKRKEYLSVRAAIAFDMGSDNARALGEAWFNDAELHEDCGSAIELQLVWRHRHANRARAKQWLCAREYESVPFCRQRARLGDPVAMRELSFTRADAFDDEEPPSAQEMSQRQIDEYHDRLLKWAATHASWSPPVEAPLIFALSQGWRDVARALELNPYLTSELLTRARREGFDEPGALLGREFFLAWSALDPSPFLASLLLTVHQTDLIGLAEEASRKTARTKAMRDDLPSTFSIYGSWKRDLDKALAIAWLRCRAAGVGVDA